MVTNRNGKIGPDTTGESERLANSLTAGTSITGRTMMIASASSEMTPIFMKVER